MGDSPPDRDDPEANAQPGPSRRPFQYGLAALFIWTTVCAVAMSFYRSLGLGPVVLIIGMTALLLYIFRLMTQIGRTAPVAIDLDSDEEAHLGCQYLREHGLTAAVLQERADFAYPLAYRRPRILVLQEEEQRARALLAEMAGRGRERIASQGEESDAPG